MTNDERSPKSEDASKHAFRNWAWYYQYVAAVRLGQTGSVPGVEPVRPAGRILDPGVKTVVISKFTLGIWTFGFPWLFVIRHSDFVI
jgi:hypothetical protein